MVETQGKIITGANILLYDGVCGLCNRFVKLILEKDSTKRFFFASLQSDFAYRVLGKYDKNPKDLNCIYVVIDYGLPTERVVAKSQAAIYALSRLGGLWALLGLARLIPGLLVDYFYDFVAKNRYKLFGKYDACLMPDPTAADRFIEL